MREPEKRFFEFRAFDDGSRIEGRVMRYGSAAKIGTFSERFQPGAFGQPGDVILNIMHERGKPVARTDAGLSLVDTAEELRAEVSLPDTPHGREARELVNARILRGFSVEFRAREEEWEASARTIVEADLLGIALVDRPAYPDAVIAARFANEYMPAHHPLTRSRRIYL